MSAFVTTPFSGITPLPSILDAAAAADQGGDYVIDQSSLLAFFMQDDADFGAAADAVFAYGGEEVADAVFAYAGEEVADALPASAFSVVRGGEQQAADVLLQPPPPAAAQIVYQQPRGAAPVPEEVSHGRKRGFVPAADDEAAVAGSSRPAARRRVQGSPSSSPAHSGGEGANEPVARAGGRRVWVRERSTEWWDRLSGPDCPDAEFRRAFRMSRATFDALCDELSAAVAKEDTALRAAIPVHQRVAVCLWRLATGEPLREVSRRFGLGISTCHNIVLQVCAALTAVLLPKVVHWPDSPAASASRFSAVSGIPGVVGAVYTDHIPIGPPKENVTEYYNRRLTERNKKASYSVAVQAVVDADGAFTDVCVGLPGSFSDASVLEKSALHARGEARLLGDGNERLVGGASYPLTHWMLVPYAHHNLTWAQHAFNERVDTARAAARGAFQRLKARWRCLQRRTEPKLPDLHNMLGACCVLHNFCERSGEGLDPELQIELSDADDDDVVAADAVRSAAAEKERDSIAHALLHGGHGVTFF